MEQSEQQKKVIDLGKKLVKELDLNDSRDTLARWMAHYIAELLVAIEDAKGREKEKLERKVFDLILSLWKHRWSMPNGKRPLEDFEPLLNMLQKLNTENKDPYFYPKLPFKQKKGKKLTSREKEFAGLLSMAESIDKIARVWLNEILHEAATVASDQSMISWLQSAVIVPNDHDRQIIIKLIEDKLPDTDDKDGMEEFGGRLTKATIEERIKQLSLFTEINEQMINIYKSQLTD